MRWQCYRPEEEAWLRVIGTAGTADVISETANASTGMAMTANMARTAARCPAARTRSAPGSAMMTRADGAKWMKSAIDSAASVIGITVRTVNARDVNTGGAASG